MPNELTTSVPITTDVPSNVPWSEHQTNSKNEVNVGLESPLLPMVINSWNHTEGNEHAWYILNRTPGGSYKPKPTTISSVKKNDDRTNYNIGPDNHDTIGIIAIDVNHQIRAGTSTYGLEFTIPGRVGDSPIPGAGAYADNEVGAATATGNGDIIMRYLPTLLAVEAMRVGKTPAEAAEVGIQRILKYHTHFYGAVIAVNRLGEYGVSCYGWKEFSIVISSPVKSGPNTRTETVKCLPSLLSKDSINNNI
ncbi:uncharacterized protein Dwil_GK26787 [Drosophila willistoni]|uniref:N(4)-(beta-N-acetylglucosaminyl)-L-asparaginase n=1 Tax=Drosophila willistoni TaxID=7260 RepID=A0A0Q9X1U0_DROWI|nr:uncharacterized protein Dwil_GK26787 [Drosophila willistoni]